MITKNNTKYHIFQVDNNLITILNKDQNFLIRKIKRTCKKELVIYQRLIQLNIVRI